jgi:hypothetical protein
MRAAAAVIVATLLAAPAAFAQTPPPPVLKVAIVVRGDGPPLLDPGGQTSAESVDALTATRSALLRLATLKTPFAVSANPVWIDELLATGQTAVYASLLTAAAHHPVLAEPYDHVVLSGMSDADAIGRELDRGRAAVRDSLETAPVPVLDPPDLALSDAALAAARAGALAAALAPAALTGPRPVSGGGVTLIPADVMPDTAPAAALIDRYGTQGEIAVVARPDERLLPAIADLSADARIALVNVTDLGGPAPPARVRFPSPPSLPRTYIEALTRAGQAVAAFGSYTLAGNQTAKLVRLLLARAASTADWEHDWAAGIERARAVARIADAQQQRVSVADGSVTLTSRRGAVPVTLVNRAGYAVRVRVLVTSPKLIFPDGDARTVTVSPAGTTITFVAEARSTGTFPMDVALTSPNGSVAFVGGHVTVRSTAANILALVLTGSGLAFLLVWSSRDLIRRRLRRPPR